MQQTRRELLDDFLGFTTEKGDANARNVAERMLNRAVLKVWMAHPWLSFVSSAPITVSTVAGQRGYALRSDFGRVSGRDGRVRNVTTGGYLSAVDREVLEGDDPAFGTTLEQRGQPRAYLTDGSIGVHTQPDSAGEACEVVSSSGTDTTVRVYVEGINGNDQYTRTQVTLTGLTPIAVGTWKRIERFAKSLPEGLDPATELHTSVGTVTLRVTSDATELQVLLPDEAAVELPTLTVYPTPNAVYTLSVPFLRAPRRLVHDADPLPRFWGNALFEEMCAEWAVNLKKVMSSAQIPRPHLGELIMWDNAQRVAAQRFRQPYGGGH
jgi:hypothetical protein